MTQDRLDRLSELFERALTVPAPSRPAFVASACDDVELRRELVALLSAHETPSGPFDTLAEEISGPGGGAASGRLRPLGWCSWPALAWRNVSAAVPGPISRPTPLWRCPVTCPAW